MLSLYSRFTRRRLRVKTQKKLGIFYRMCLSFIWWQRFGGLKTQKSQTPLESGKVKYAPAQRLRLNGKYAKDTQSTPTRLRRVGVLSCWGHMVNKHVGLYPCRGPSGYVGCYNKCARILLANVQNMYGYHCRAEEDLWSTSANFGCSNSSEANQTGLDETWQD